MSRKTWIDGNEAIHTETTRSRPWAGTVFEKDNADSADALVAMAFGATVEECVERARLIAAAPDLLEALQDALRDGGVSGWEDRAQAAIARATGAA